MGAGGENIIVSHFPPMKYADTVTKKDCFQREKYDLISLLPYFPPVHGL
jgi:hypothetical protein